MENENIAGNEATASQPGEQSEPEQTFTKTQVNDMMRKRVERSHQSFFNRYGVKDLAELDELIGQSRSYGPMKERFDELSKNHEDLINQHNDLTKRYAYHVGNINPDKYNDIETYFKGKNLDINEQTLSEELKSHPDWIKKVANITPIGAEATQAPTVDEKALASQYLGVTIE